MSSIGQGNLYPDDREGVYGVSPEERERLMFMGPAAPPELRERILRAAAEAGPQVTGTLIEMEWGGNPEGIGLDDLEPDIIDGPH